MENPIDTSIDLGFVNYVQHPENKNYIVFRFKDLARAKSFEEELTSQKIWFEKGEEEKGDKHYTLFGLKNHDFKKAQKINYKVEGIHKKPVIAFAPVRWIVFVIGMGLLTLALVGYCKAQKTLDEATRATEQSLIQ